MDIDAIVQFIIGLVQHYPWFGAVVAVVGTFRLFAKPLISLVESYILSSASKTDDEWLLKFKSGPVWAVLNYLLSIKIPDGTVKVTALVPPKKL